MWKRPTRRIPLTRNHREDQALPTTERNVIPRWITQQERESHSHRAQFIQKRVVANSEHYRKIRFLEAPCLARKAIAVCQKNLQTEIETKIVTAAVVVVVAAVLVVVEAWRIEIVFELYDVVIDCLLSNVIPDYQVNFPVDPSQGIAVR